jgi:transposase
MQTVTTIGLDIAKSVFQVHGVDAAGQVLIREVSGQRKVHNAASGRHDGPDRFLDMIYVHRKLEVAVSCSHRNAARILKAPGLQWPD